MIPDLIKGTLSWLRDCCRRLWIDEEALTTMEYALLFALMVGAVVLAYQNLGWLTAESVRESDSALPEPNSGAENPDPGISGPS